MEKKSISLLPLDNRPVSYLLPKQIADFSGINLILPERENLGDLKRGSNLSYIETWLNNIVGNGCNHSLSLIIALDNWVYGGLVQSRKHAKSLSELKERINFIKELSKIKKYGFSSILRISNNNYSEEEKEYWKDYGEKIFKWSELMHKVGRGVKEKGSSHEELIENWYQSSKLIPSNILSEYKGHRDKNFTINLEWLESLHSNCFQYLIFSCDDSSKYGMNVVEAEYLKEEIRKHNFSKIANVTSGTDETPLGLLTKAILEKSKIKPTISVYFNSIEGMNHNAKYESCSINTSILSQLKILDIEIKESENPDIILYVHLADSAQGDHVFGELPKDTKNNAFKLTKLLEETNKPFILVDLAYANGADPVLVEALLKAKINWNMCYGYAAWNTCSNSVGSALAIGINRWISEKEKTFSEEAFRKCLLTRFLDDYAYQTQIRHSNVTEEEINKNMKNYIELFSKLLGLTNIQATCKLPWKRSFEVEIDV